MSNLNSIGAVIIGKNVSDSIENTINSLLSVCSQIIFVDTGSEDGTAEIVTRLGAEIYFFKWNNNFSDARNFGLKFLRCNWALIIDSDEILDLKTFIKYKNLDISDEVGGLNIKIKNYLNREDQTIFQIHHYTRIFRNHPQIQFAGAIHEQIRPAIEKMNLSIIDTEIIIEHYGYQESNPEKKQRNLSLLKEEILHNDNDIFLKYHLATTEFSLGDLENAFLHFKEINDSPLLSTEQQEISHLRLAQIELSKDNVQNVYFWLKDEFENMDNEGLRLFILAAAKMLENKFAEAKMLYLNEKVQKSSLVDKNIINQALEILKTII
jgi:glycosyltransferase involved in cell wall biosynthesis